MNKYDEKSTVELLHEAYWYVRHVDRYAGNCLDSHINDGSSHTPCYG